MLLLRNILNRKSGHGLERIKKSKGAVSLIAAVDYPIVKETGMKATIWHNPKCGTSRRTLAILENLSGVELTVVEYLKEPPSQDKLEQLFRAAGITLAEGLRLRGTDAEERGLPDAADDNILAAMSVDPILIERPLVETEKGVRLCRPQDRVLEIL